MCLSDFISFLISRVLGTNTEKQPENFFFHKWFEIISVWDFKTLEVIMKWVTYFWCCASFLEMYFKINFEDSQYKSCFNKRFFFLCFHHTGIYSVRFKQSRLTSPWQVNEFSVHWRQLVLNFSLKQISFKQKKTQTPYNNVFNIYPQFSNFGICHILFFFSFPAMGALSRKYCNTTLMHGMDGASSYSHPCSKTPCDIQSSGWVLRLRTVSDIKLIRMGPTLDLSQKAKRLESLHS